MSKIQFDSDNLIYNRFDLIHQGEYGTYEYRDDDKEYVICAYRNRGVAEVNLWGKVLPQDVFNSMVKELFQSPGVYAISVTRGGNQYFDFLEETNDIRIPLPESFDELMNRAERRDRATIRRKLRWLDERIGVLKIDVYPRSEISDDIVETYFDWKKETHGTEYGLKPAEYLDKYHVTDAMLMRAGDMDVAIAFFCQAEDIVFFENFSYNSNLKEYSPGLLMYVKFMEELIKRKCRYLYLGGGGYIYKKRFGAESFRAYSGRIYRKEIIDSLNSFFERREIRRIAFYGYGVCGHAFCQLAGNLRIEVIYGIDRKHEISTGIKLYDPQDDLPDADAVIITLNNRNNEVDDLLKKRFDKTFYWNQILDDVAGDYSRRVDEGN